ncbi:unnamed protein product [Arabidopsis halleri]
MSEDDLPYQVKINGQGDLETIGRFGFDDQIDCSVIAHSKVDATTGDLHTLSYNVLRKPHLRYLKFDTCGKKTRDVDITLPEPTMIHDFAITENFVVIPDQQMVFKLTEMIRGGSPVIYDKEKMSRFEVLSKQIRPVRRTEDGDPVIVIIGSCMSPPDTIFSESGEPTRIELSEIRLNMRTKESNRKVIVIGINLEAGHINKSFVGRKNRGIAKVDIENGTVSKFDTGPGRLDGEPYFVPEGEGEEDKGYVMGFVRDEEKD